MELYRRYDRQQETSKRLLAASIQRQKTEHHRPRSPRVFDWKFRNLFSGPFRDLFIEPVFSAAEPFQRLCYASAWLMPVTIPQKFPIFRNNLRNISDRHKRDIVSGTALLLPLKRKPPIVYPLGCDQRHEGGRAYDLST